MNKTERQHMERLRSIGRAHIATSPPPPPEPNPVGQAIVRATIRISGQNPYEDYEAMNAYIELQRPLIEARRRLAQAELNAQTL